MFIECAICGTVFEAARASRQYCDKCQKNTAKARERMQKNIQINRRNAGDVYYNEAKHRNCKHCGKPFVTYEGRDFCSFECIKQYRTEQAICKECGKELFVEGVETSNVAGYCSDACRSQATWKRARYKGIVTKCMQCNEEFINTGLKYDICELCRSEKPKETMATQGTPTNGIVADICTVCGAEFHRHRNATQYTCKKECRDIRNKEQRQKASEDRERKRTSKRMPPAYQSREESVKAALSGEPADDETTKLHLCTECCTSQAACIRFASSFACHPEGAKTKLIAGQNVVLICPQYGSSQKHGGKNE